MNMKIIITGGGTGGHAYPALSIAAALRTEYPDCEILYVGSRDGIESRLAHDAGVPFVGLTSRKVKKLVSADTIITGAYMMKGLCEAIGALRNFQPDVVIGTGGYVAASVVMAQVLRRGKTLIVEPDVIPGRTNVMLSRFATKICVAFEEAAERFPAGRAVVTGMPVRSELKRTLDKGSARIALGLKPDLFTLIVVGGSQGAKKLNEVVLGAVSELRKLPVQVLHQTGTRNFDDVKNVADKIGCADYHVRAYLDDMVSAYASADLAMCRSGSSTIAEITAVGLPAIMVPYPYAHKDHQRYNAEVVAKNGAGMLVLDSQVTSEFLVKTVELFLESPEELHDMAIASKEFGKSNAAEDIAHIAAGMK